jgi:putative phosphoserine phosphatase/1-acylglycerol-3-phosphate O-acyltransferase
MQTMIGAFFDLDGTLYNGRIWQELTRHLWRARQHRRWVVAYLARNMAPMPFYKLGLTSQEAFYHSWAETMSWLIRGWTEGAGQALFEQLTGEVIMPHLRPEPLSALRKHQDQGHVVALVSGTFAPWLETVARHLEVAHAVGTLLEVRDGRYTGRILPPLCQGPGKPARVKAYLEGRGLQVDWTASYAYADSGTDLHLMNRVGRPVAVCPDEILLSRARKQGWPILGEVEP